MGTGICPFCGKKVNKVIMFRGDVVGCRYCGIHTKQTNADRIRSMTDEELAMWCAIMFDKDAIDGTGDSFEAWIKWLQEEVAE